MIFKVFFGDIKLKVGYHDLETLSIIAESNNINFIAIYQSDFEQDEVVNKFKEDNPLIY